ncbi:hypothetical protein GCM10027184_64220 [Saccharothrix stipae]
MQECLFLTVKTAAVLTRFSEVKNSAPIVTCGSEYRIRKAPGSPVPAGAGGDSRTISTGTIKRLRRSIVGGVRFSAADPRLNRADAGTTPWPSHRPVPCPLART